MSMMSMTKNYVARNQHETRDQAVSLQLTRDTKNGKHSWPVTRPGTAR